MEVARLIVHTVACCLEVRDAGSFASGELVKPVGDESEWRVSQLGASSLKKRIMVSCRTGLVFVALDFSY